MNTWPYQVIPLTQAEILEAVKDTKWQEFRLSLKGISTKDKLLKLHKYIIKHRAYEDQIRVSNYINALLRGGQLVRRGMLIEVQR